MKQETITIGKQEITFEMGEIARQANGAVLVRQKDTVLLVTAVAAEKPRENLGFFPLTVEFREKTAAVGKFPGGFIKRENRPHNHEILTSRLIDRSIRPLFPKKFLCETQIMATVFSYDSDSCPQALALMGTAMALQISDIPWNGPVCGIHAVKKNGELILLPDAQEKENAELDLMVACGPDGMIMLEGVADETSEEDILECIEAASQAMKPFFDLAQKWRSELGVTTREYEVKEASPELVKEIQEKGQEKLKGTFVHSSKQERKKQIREATSQIKEELMEKYPEEAHFVSELLSDLLHHSVREYMVNDQKRIDLRDFSEIRPISGRVGWLPRNHGSALFTRGDTQAIVSCTLGSLDDEQVAESLDGVTREKFLLHYNFPPFCVGEARPLRPPGRREIGHGNLALRALCNMIPKKNFPYTIRILSDITESNGSSSMASVCGGSLAMMDAGVPIKKPVAGIAMGMIKQGENFVILSDIMGDEDHLGDMDFKVTGTADGITALQVDNKIGSLSSDILTKALAQAKDGRLHILSEMNKVLAESRPELSRYSPRVASTTIRKERIRSLIGPGGKHIQEIQNTNNVKIDVDSDTSEVRIFAQSGDDCEKALKRVKYYTGDVEVNKVYRGVVVATKDFGAFVRVYFDTEGLVHISELDEARVEKVTDILKEGDEVIVRVLGIDRQGKIKLSRREALNANPSDIVN